MTNRRHVLTVALACIVSVLARQRTSVGEEPSGADRPSIEYRWIATPGAIQGQTWSGEASTPSATLASKPELVGSQQHALVLDGRRQSVTVGDSILSHPLPDREISLEAWVAIEQPAPWGAFIGAIRDNGNDERGFLLGYRDDRFCFAVATEHGGKLTYLTAPESFAPGRWYHVVGTYDGRTMRLYIDGQAAAESTDQRGDIWMPESGWLALGAYRDDNEFYKSVGRIHELAIHGRVLAEADIKENAARNREPLPVITQPESPDTVAEAGVFGPIVEPIARGEWQISWLTETEATGVLEFGRNREVFRTLTSSTEPATQHQVRLSDAPQDGVYEIRIRGEAPRIGEFATQWYPLDTMLCYPELPSVSESQPSVPLSFAEANVKALLDRSPARSGFAVLANSDVETALALATETSFQVVLLLASDHAVAEARRALESTSTYGVRVTVLPYVPAEPLPFGPMFANLVVLDQRERANISSPVDITREELFRLVRPTGGVLAIVAEAASTVDETDKDAATLRWLTVRGEQDPTSTGVESTKIESNSDTAMVHSLRREALTGAGEWTHQYGHADNSSCSRDEIIEGPLTVQWWGRPGSRPMPDRGPRNPAPVSANGRLYVQGNRTLFGLDAYNGTILWFKQLPSMRRANLPRDASNMVAHEDQLLVAVQSRCAVIDGQTGKIESLLQAPQPIDGGRFDWGYVSARGATVFGSCVRSGAAYLGDDGEWYEDYGVSQVARVVSDAIFSIDLRTAEPEWLYEKGMILNSTITRYDGTFFFIESRNPEAKAAKSGRMLDEIQQDQVLVALDESEGGTRWEIPEDFSMCQFMTYLCASNGKLVVVGTDKAKTYHIKVFNAENGEKAWEHQSDPRKSHHSGHLAHPTVVGNRLYVNKLTLDLHTGEILDEDTFDWHGCGVMSASSNTIFHRFEYHGMLDLKTKDRTEFLGLRSGCWLSLIPSGGLLLAPETSAGCSCTHAIQTSIGFVPRALTQQRAAVLTAKPEASR